MAGLSRHFAVAGIVGAVCASAMAQDTVVMGKHDASPQALLEALTPPRDTPALPAQGATRSFKISKSGDARPAAPSKPASASLMITFDTESSQLTADSRRILNNLAIALNANRLAGLRFQIEGHADPRGTSELNLKLSQERARAVRTHLVDQLQIDPARLVALGKGDAEPLNVRDPAAAENRRVRIVTLSD